MIIEEAEPTLSIQKIVNQDIVWFVRLQIVMEITPLLKAHVLLV